MFKKRIKNMSTANFTIKLSLFAVLNLVFLFVYLSVPFNQYTTVTTIVNSSSATRSEPLQIQAAPTIKKRFTPLPRIEQQLARARRRIHRAIVSKNFTYSKKWNFIPEGSIYQNPYAFQQSHIEMMKTFKVWIYREGEIPLLHNGPTRHLYAIEGIFINQMEREEYPMVAAHPDEAHAFYIPISITNIVYYLFKPPSTGNFLHRIQDIVEDYIATIANKYPYWNRTNGADHFLVSCHDWAPYLSKRNPKLFKNFIRVICNANTSEGFVPSRDVSMTEIYGPLNYIPSVNGGESPHSRTILAFFAGGNHGVVRNILFQHWGNKKDKDIMVYDHLPKGLNYTKFMSKSKFCLCPSGYEVASPRAVEAIYVGCVPVMISDHYVLPYSDVLDWSQFSVQVPLDRIPDLKRILEEIPFAKYLKMQKRVMRVQKHFRINTRVQPFDVFHMILHSVWLRRLNVKLLVP